jgi:hypothetical protein
MIDTGGPVEGPNLALQLQSILSIAIVLIDLSTGRVVQFGRFWLRDLECDLLWWSKAVMLQLTPSRASVGKAWRKGARSGDKVTAFPIDQHKR